MFSSNKRNKAPREKRSDAPKMIGIGMPLDDDDEDDDDSLLAELAALQGKQMPKKKAAPSKKLVSMDEIARMANENMRDFDDDEMSDADLENDMDLLAELQEIASDEEDTHDHTTRETHVTEPQSSLPQDNDAINTITERESMYQAALSAAEKSGESSKARRYKRGLDEVKKMKKSASSGKPVNLDDLPPPVATKGAVVSSFVDATPQAAAPAPTPVTRPQPAPRPQSAPRQEHKSPPQAAPRPVAANINSNVDSNLIDQLLSKQKEFKIAALGFKNSGDIEGARQCMGVSKEINKMIEDAKNGEQIDTSALPSSPSALSTPKVESTPSSAPAQAQPAEASPVNQSSSSSSAVDPPMPKTALEAMEQRLIKYQSGEKEAKDGGNSSKARRMGRIVKQYQDAIKMYKAGKAVDFEELPIPPGFPPIPGGSAPASASQTAPAAHAAPATQAASAGPSSSSGPPQASRNEKEYDFLMRRQKEFKIAALNAKKQGDMDGAKDYLRQAKGLDQMIVAAQNGLRVDVTQVPSVKKSRSASTKSNHSDVVQIEDASAEITGTPAEVYQRLELSLKKQIETSQRNVKHYSLLGDLSATKSFESLLRSSKQDLETVRVTKSRGDPVPKFHFEIKTFPIVRSNPELSDSEIEIEIVRCINVPLPSGYQTKDLYVYVIYEFPIPSDDGQTGSTATIKQTINPEFNEKFKVTIDRKSRSLLRTLRRQGLVLKVMYVRGFLKSDKALGQTTIKLETFSNKCDIHECVDLMDPDRGRKAVGGKIEVKLKIREPLVDKDAEIVKERWLVIDTHLRKLEMETPRTSSVKAQPSSNSACSLEILKFEKDIAEKQISALKAQGRPAPPHLVDKIKTCDAKSKEIGLIFKEGGIKGVQAYLRQLKDGLPIEQKRAQDAMRSGNKEEAKMCLLRKKLLEKEIDALRKRLGPGN